MGQRPATAKDLTPGTSVFVPRLGTKAEVIESPERGQVRVRAGAFVLRVGVDELRHEEGTALLLATHDQRLAAAADRLVHLQDGRQVEPM